ncbi:hypothetical protein [Roseateles sp.]|uniref:hypothetical protein n=1 Tax=Roseateles sp. TaxID=1971397 RepID=UPI003263AFB2
MPEIKNRTMLIAIQAVAAHIRAMREELADGDVDPEDYVLLEQAMDAAEDLERAYDVEAKTVLNLPPYDELVAG